MFPDKLPYGPPPNELLTMRSIRRQELHRRTKAHIGLVRQNLDEMKRQIDALLEQGWIRPSSSPYGAPILFIPKKGWKMENVHRTTGL